MASSVIVSDMANVSSLTMQPNSSLDMFEPLQSDLKDKSIRKTGTKRWCMKGKTCMRRCKKAKKCKGGCKKCRKICDRDMCEDVTALMFNPQTSDVDTSNDPKRVEFENEVLGFVKADNLIRLRICLATDAHYG